jgi:predicted transcriptional regulator
MPRFGELEAAIMDAVWAADAPVRVRDVLERLERDPEPAYTTVQTVMDVLFRKGWLTRTKHGRVNIYTATARREDYVGALLSDALDQAPQIDRAGALVKFVERMDPVETEALRAILAAAKRDRSRPAGSGRDR